MKTMIKVISFLKIQVNASEYKGFVSVWFKIISPPPHLQASFKYHKPQIFQWIILRETHKTNSLKPPAINLLRCFYAILNFRYQNGHA